jgi:hypothetical protein
MTEVARASEMAQFWCRTATDSLFRQKQIEAKRQQDASNVELRGLVSHSYLGGVRASNDGAQKANHLTGDPRSYFGPHDKKNELIGIE